MIRRGPETADLELYQWDGLHDRWDEQPSGFAPYELARLTKDSGGIYFVLPSEEFMRIRQREQAYSITQLKEYLPEYDNRLTYVEKRNSSPFRQLLHDDRHGGQELPLPPRLPDRAARSWSRRPSRRGKRPPSSSTSLLEIQNRLESFEKLRDREPEKRWQAHYDLMLAQTVAFQVKAYEYRALMASIVKTPPSPSASRPRSDDHLGRRSFKDTVGPSRTRPPRSTPKPSGCSRRSSLATPRPPGRTWRRTPSTAASPFGSTSGTDNTPVRSQVLNEVAPTRRSQFVLPSTESVNSKSSGLRIRDSQSWLARIGIHDGEAGTSHGR